MNNEEICNCMGVTREEIVNACKSGNLTTVEEVGEATGAGTGCCGCCPDIQAILDEINA